MKKIIILLALLQVSCIQVIYAQNLPKTITIGWDANTDTVTSYEVTLDSGTPIVVLPTASPSSPVTINSLGHHVITIIAKNAVIVCDDPTQCNTVQVSSSVPSAPLGFTLSAAASQVKNLKIK